MKLASRGQSPPDPPDAPCVVSREQLPAGARNRDVARGNATGYPPKQPRPPARSRPPECIDTRQRVVVVEHRNSGDDNARIKAKAYAHARRLGRTRPSPQGRPSRIAGRRVCGQIEARSKCAIARHKNHDHRGRASARSPPAAWPGGWISGTNISRQPAVMFARMSFTIQTV